MNRGRRFLIRESRALNHALILRLGKRLTVLFCALNRETRLDQFQLAGPLSEKSQKAVAARDTNLLIGTNFLPGWEPSTKKGRDIGVVCVWLLEGGSGVVILVEYLSLVYAHDPVESDYKE
jgi:hypothetical protein